MAEISENTPQKAPQSPENVYIETKNGHKVHINTMNNLKPFPKGVSGNAAGKPAGVKSDKRKQWEALHESIAGRHTERFNRVLATLDDEKFMDNYLRILEYFKPRLQRAENINMNTQLDRVVLVTSPDDIPTLPDNFDEAEEITPDEVQSEGDNQE